MAGRCGEGREINVKEMVTEGSQQGRMDIYNKGGQGSQMAIGPRSMVVNKPLHCLSAIWGGGGVHFKWNV